MEKSPSERHRGDLLAVVKLMLADVFQSAYIKAEFWRSAVLAELQNRAHLGRLARRRGAVGTVQLSQAPLTAGLHILV